MPTRFVCVYDLHVYACIHWHAYMFLQFDGHTFYRFRFSVMVCFNMEAVTEILHQPSKKRFLCDAKSFVVISIDKKQ